MSVQNTTSIDVASQAKEFFANPRFHKTFSLPKTADHEELTVGYSDLGRQPDSLENASTIPTILVMPGMFASRHAATTDNAIAEKFGIRMLVADRPGMGLSTDVPLENRISWWIELVPKLLEHLSIKHVSLLSHSAGTLYLLNTLYDLRHILDPQKPLVFMFAPLVDSTYSKATAMQISRQIPQMAFGIWNKIPQFFAVDAAPAFAASGSVFTQMSNMMPTFLKGESKESILKQSSMRREAKYGIPFELQVAMQSQCLEMVFKEDTKGANSEALQCLRKGPPGLWKRCDNYEKFVKDLAELERGRQKNDPGNAAKLKVMTYFAETDILLGEGGKSYMQACWNGSKDGEFQDAFDFESKVVPGTDHDSVFLFLDTMEEIFPKVGGNLVNS